MTLDEHSFQLVDCLTSLSNWDFYNDEQKIHDVYYKEMEEVLKKYTGCEYVHVFHHQLRNSDMSTKTEASGDRYPKAGTVHCNVIFKSKLSLIGARSTSTLVASTSTTMGRTPRASFRAWPRPSPKSTTPEGSSSLTFGGTYLMTR